MYSGKGWEMTRNLRGNAGSEQVGVLRHARPFDDHDNLFDSMRDTVTPCFTSGTAIATPIGERPVEDLKPGDQVVTRDNGIQEIRWTGHRALSADQLARSTDLQPVLLRRGCLGGGLPERDMLLSPNHRVLVANDRTALYFKEQEVFASAKYLINHKGIERGGARQVTYHHFMFDRHEAVLSDGCWTESFQPTDPALQGMGNAQRTEILGLFPDLRTASGETAFPTARKDLSELEARALQR